MPRNDIGARQRNLAKVGIVIATIAAIGLASSVVGAFGLFVAPNKPVSTIQTNTPKTMVPLPSTPKTVLPVVEAISSTVTVWPTVGVTATPSPNASPTVLSVSPIPTATEDKLDNLPIVIVPAQPVSRFSVIDCQSPNKITGIQGRLSVYGNAIIPASGYAKVELLGAKGEWQFVGSAINSNRSGGLLAQLAPEQVKSFRAGIVTIRLVVVDSKEQEKTICSVKADVR